MCVCVPVVQVLGYDEVFEVVVYGSLVVLQQGVGVAQAVAGLGLHRTVLQLPGQLQSPPEEHRSTTLGAQLNHVRSTTQPQLNHVRILSHRTLLWGV